MQEYILYIMFALVMVCSNIHSAEALGVSDTHGARARREGNFPSIDKSTFSQCACIVAAMDYSIDVKYFLLRHAYASTCTRRDIV